jgi:hypothetical protein
VIAITSVFASPVAGAVAALPTVADVSLTGVPTPPLWAVLSSGLFAAAGLGVARLASRWIAKDATRLPS